MQNLFSYIERQEHSKPPPQDSTVTFRPLNPRSSYQEQHSNYFQKLQEHLLEKSNRYTSLIGKKGFAKHPANVAVLQKISQLKHKNPNSITHQTKPSKHNSFTQLSVPRKQSHNSSLHKSINNEDSHKPHFNPLTSEFIPNHSRTNLHSEAQTVESKAYTFRQETERNHDLKKLQPKQKNQEKALYFSNESIATKNSKNQYIRPSQLTSKIDHIKEIINSFNNAKKIKIKQKHKESPLELQRKLVYNLTYEDNNTSGVQDLPEVGGMRESKIKKSMQNESHFIKTGGTKDNMSSTISTKFSINHGSNESSKVSFFKKQNEHEENASLCHEKLKQKPSKGILPSNKSTQPFQNNVSKLVSQLGSKVSLKSSIKQCKPLTIKDFAILAEIGQGKTGIVYMAKHIESNFVCALKVINREILNENVIVQLIREINIQFYLDHPNIVQMYAFFSDEAHIYLMLELCFSGNLYTHLRREKLLTEAEIKPIIKQVCYALEFMHDNEIIHRDLKPENILFHENIVKICDLGWAVYSPLPRDTLCGTPIYASPELVEKKKYNSKIDVWNVGVMAYELLCGRVPFEIRSQEDLYKVVIQEIHFPKSIPISDFCKDFINCCLKKQPENRKTITELLEHSFLNENIF